MADFGISRAPMLNILAGVMAIGEGRETAFLGRFQHLQRLRLIEGINPGRGKAAEYQAHHFVIIALAMHMLQLGLTPERAVNVIKSNKDRVHLAISLAVGDGDKIMPSVLWFDAAALSASSDEDYDWADETFDYGGKQSMKDRFANFFDHNWVQRMSFISVSGTLWAIIRHIEGGGALADHEPKMGENSRVFLRSLSSWTRDCNQSEPF